jgi:asparagine synthase (glutamine-hydrolysing)
MAITGDVRLDNRVELAQRLGRPGLPGGTLSDGELIIAAYERWGEDCATHLLGDFAFALWDGRQRTLFCARDVFGVKPFYYHQSSDLFAFASDVDGVLSVPGVPTRLNQLRLSDYLLALSGDPASTIYEDVSRLPPARTMTVNAGGASLRRYWTPDAVTELHLGSEEEYDEAFRHVLEIAVRDRMPSEHAVGAFLSGGLDSSSIVCAAQRQRPEALCRRSPRYSTMLSQATSESTPSPSSGTRARSGMCAPRTTSVPWPIGKARHGGDRSPRWTPRSPR